MSLKQNSEVILESVDSYDHLLEQRARATDKKEIKKIDAKIEESKKYLISLCNKIKQDLAHV